MATPAEIADFHRKIKPDTFWQKLCLIWLCFATTAPAMELAGFSDFLPDWHLAVWVVLSSMVGVFVGFTYYPQWRYGIVGVLPGMFAGPCVLLLTYFYTLGRETVYKAEMALVWVVGLAPAALFYYLAMRLIVLSTSRTTAPARFAPEPAIEPSWPAEQLVAAEAKPQQFAPSTTPSASPFAGPAVVEPIAEQPKTRNYWLLWLAGGTALAVIGLAVMQGNRNQQAAQQPILPNQPVPNQPVPNPAVPNQPIQEPNVPNRPVPNPAAPNQPAAQPGRVPFLPEPRVATKQPQAQLSSDEVDKAISNLTSPKKQEQRQAADRLANAQVAEENRERVVTALINLLHDTDLSLRRHAMAGLGNLRAASAAEPLVARLAVLGDRSSAATALRSIGQGAEHAVLAALDQQDVFVRAEACRILETIGTQASVDRLQAATKDKNGLVSTAAKQALAAITARL